MEADKDGSKSLWTKQLKSKSTNGYNYGLRIMKDDEKGLHLPSIYQGKICHCNWLQLAAHNHIADYLIVPSAS